MNDLTQAVAATLITVAVCTIAAVILATNQWPWQWRRPTHEPQPGQHDNTRCPECGWPAPTREARDAHIMIEHGSGDHPDKLVCPHCLADGRRVTFRHWTTYVAHLGATHRAVP